MPPSVARVPPPAYFALKTRMPETSIPLHHFPIVASSRGSRAPYSLHRCPRVPASSTRTFLKPASAASIPCPDNLSTVGGYKMHIYCTGQGSPTVILDAGMGDSFISWRKVQPEIAKFTRVCSYDRAGIGYSDSSPRPSTSKDFAQELHMLLHNAGVAPPYVLVGHSMGGFDVRLYASLYRNEVVGMVLVDSSHPEQQKRLPPELKDLDATWLREQEFFEFTMPFGIPRLLGFCGNDACNPRRRLQLPQRARKRCRAEGNLRERCSNRYHRLTRRHASGGPLARS